MLPYPYGVPMEGVCGGCKVVMELLEAEELNRMGSGGKVGSRIFFRGALKASSEASKRKENLVVNVQDPLDILHTTSTLEPRCSQVLVC